MCYRTFVVGALTALPLAGGCAPSPGTMGMSGMPDMKRMEQKQELMQKLMSDPQIPPWYQGREKVTLAMGDRVFDKPFDRVFDSCTIALANLEANVNNMERQSGYITSAVPRLDPERQERLRDDAMVEYVRYHKYDPKILEKQGAYDIDVDAYSSLGRMGQAMTISLVRQSENQTKVKIRFSNVNYPRELEEYYKTVWPAIDKQIFLDRNLD
jgi:hypothetical protein